MIRGHSRTYPLDLVPTTSERRLELPISAVGAVNASPVGSRGRAAVQIFWGVSRDWRWDVRHRMSRVRGTLRSAVFGAVGGQDATKSSNCPNDSQVVLCMFVGGTLMNLYAHPMTVPSKMTQINFASFLSLGCTSLSFLFKDG